jgi:hypothetical protein
LRCTQFLVGRSKSIMGSIENLSGDGVEVARVGEGEGICCQDESWGGRGWTFVFGARTRKGESGRIVGRRMETFRRILKASCALSNSLTRERPRWSCGDGGDDQRLPTPAAAVVVVVASVARDSWRVGCVEGILLGLIELGVSQRRAHCEKRRRGKRTMAVRTKSCGSGWAR